MTPFSASKEQLPFAPDPWNTRKKIAGHWVEWKTGLPEPTPEQVLEAVAPTAEQRHAEAIAVANSMLAEPADADHQHVKHRKMDPQMILIRRLVKVNDILLAILQSKGILTVADVAAIKHG